jgi:hypothetical protein
MMKNRKVFFIFKLQRKDNCTLKKIFYMGKLLDETLLFVFYTFFLTLPHRQVKLFKILKYFFLRDKLKLNN